jgi:hypothetical protein
MHSFVKNFILGGMMCLFLFNSKAVAVPRKDPFGCLFDTYDHVVQECHQPQAVPTHFLPLLEMEADVIIESFKFSESSSPELNHRRYERDDSVFFIHHSYTLPLEDKYQYFIVAFNTEEATHTFKTLETFKSKKPLLPNQIKIVLFNLYDRETPTTVSKDLPSIVPKKNIISFILDDSFKNSCLHLCRNFHWKKWPGIRITVPLSDSRLFTQEILRDMYDRVLRQWHSRIDTVDLGMFKDQNEAAEGMLDVIGKLPPSASRWNIFLESAV